MLDSTTHLASACTLLQPMCHTLWGEEGAYTDRSKHHATASHLYLCLSPARVPSHPAWHLTCPGWG
jgi:hypothetical protein